MHKISICGIFIIYKVESAVHLTMSLVKKKLKPQSHCTNFGQQQVSCNYHRVIF